MRFLAPVVFLVIHLSGAALAILNLRLVWSARSALDTMYGPAAPVLLVCLALIGLLAVTEAGRTVGRCWRRQREPDVAIRLRGLVYFALVCLFVDVFVLSSMSLLPEISVTIAYGAYALWSALLPGMRRALPRSTRTGLDLLCGSAALSLVLAEVSLRLWSVLWPTPLLATSYAAPPFNVAAHRLRPGSLHFGFPANSSGHLDTEFVARSERGDRLVVASIGDSFSVGAVPHPFHFTNVVERGLPGVEVYNMGVASIGLPGYAYLLEREALPLEPDLVVVNLFLGNDVTDGIVYEGPPRWYDPNHYRVALLWRRARILMSTPPIAWPGRGDLAASYPWLSDPLVEKPTFDRELFLEIESKRALRVCGPDDELYRLFFEAFEELERAAGDLPLVFVLIPDEFQVEDDLWEEVLRRGGRSLDRDRPQREVGRFLRDRGYAVLDLLPVLRAVEPLADGRQHLYHLQDTHFNLRGNEVAGRAIAPFVESQLSTLTGYVKPPPTARLARSSSDRETELTISEAVDFTHSYGRVLRGVPSGGSRVLSASLLPQPRSRIEDALFMMLGSLPEPDDRKFLKAAVLRLAYFQEGVGDGGADLDVSAPDGRRWRVVVNAELLSLTRRLEGEGYD